MEGLKGVELGEKEVEGAEEFERGGRVEVDDGWEGEAQEQVVCCASSQTACVEVGHAREVGLVEEKCIEPVYAAFVTVTRKKDCQLAGTPWGFKVRVFNLRFS